MFKKGFTLIELLVVISIISILAVLLMPRFVSARTKARNSTAKSDISEIGKAIELLKGEDVAGSVYGISAATAQNPIYTIASLSGNPGNIDPTTCNEDSTNPSTSGCNFKKLFSGYMVTNLNNASYGVKIWRTPGTDFTYSYSAYKANGNTTFRTREDTCTTIATSLVTMAEETDTRFAIKNGSTYINNITGDTCP